MQTLLNLQKELDAGCTLQTKVGIVIFYLAKAHKAEDGYYQLMVLDTNDGKLHMVRNDAKSLEALRESWGWVFEILQSKDPNPVYDKDFRLFPGLDFDWQEMPLDGWNIAKEALCEGCQWALVDETKRCEDCQERDVFTNLLGDIEIDL
jgi:hypothetical protein